MAGDADEVKRRIECAEDELRIAKNELVRLETYNIATECAIKYLNSIGCHHSVLCGSKKAIIRIEDGYTWNVKGLSDAIHGANPSVCDNTISFR